jgi:hypothetical protein
MYNLGRGKKPTLYPSGKEKALPAFKLPTRQCQSKPLGAAPQSRRGSDWYFCFAHTELGKPDS